MPYALCQSQIMANPDINSRKAWAINANAYLLMCFKAKYFVFVRNWLKAPGIPCSHMASSIQTPYVALLRPWLPFHNTVLYNDHILLVYCKPLSLQHSASMDDIQSLTSSSSPHTFQSHDLVMKCKAPFLCSASSVVQAMESVLTTYSIRIICHGR